MLDRIFLNILDISDTKINKIEMRFSWLNIEKLNPDVQNLFQLQRGNHFINLLKVSDSENLY